MTQFSTGLLAFLAAAIASCPATAIPQQRDMVRGSQGYVFDPRAYGAVGDGAPHPADAAIGAKSLAEVASYTLDGRQPYGWIRSYPAGVLFNLDPETASGPGATEISFRAEATVGAEIATIRAEPEGSRTVTVGDLFVTSDATPVGAGTAVTGACIAPGTTVDRPPAGVPGRRTLSLSAAVTCPLPEATRLTFLVRPSAGGSSLPVVATGGINRGDLISGACIPAGTEVDRVSHARMEIVLSQPTTCRPDPGEALRFVPSWLRRVDVGMQVSGPVGAIAAGTTVAKVDAATGSVVLSAPLLEKLTPDTALIGVEQPTSATPLTFYRPYTDAEAAGLQMDRLGLQAAINAAEAAGGGSVALSGAGSTWLVDGPLILPITATAGVEQAAVSFGGLSKGPNGATIEPTADFGPGSALLACGDPTAKASNGRGLYQGAAGYFCPGSLHDLRLGPASASFKYGLRPRWATGPVAMDGVKEGPRLDWEGVAVTGFDNGVLAAFDHTRLSDVVLRGNFNGLRMDDRQPNLFGDDVFDRLYAYANAWAGISVSPRAFINAEINKPYLADSPYAIYCEAGPGAGLCVQGTTIIGANDENLGCGSIKDGGIEDGWVGAGGSRSVDNLRYINGFELGRGGFGPDQVPIPAGGCQWAAYFDIGYASDFSIETVWPNSFAPVPDAFASVLRVSRLDGFRPIGAGGFRMTGAGVWPLIQNARTAHQNIVGGPDGFSGPFWKSGSWQYVSLDGATFRARAMPLVDPAATGLRFGTLLDYSPNVLDGVFGVQRAGQPSGRVLAGVSCQDDWTDNPAAQQIAPVVCHSGNRLPLATETQARPGQVLKASTTEFGTAVPATSVTDGPVAGLSLGAGTSPRLTYIEPLWAAQP